MTESFELFCKENAFLIGMDVWQNINPHEYLTSSNDKDDYAIRVKDFETYLNKALEQSRLEGIEEGKKLSEEEWKSTAYYATQQHEAMTNAKIEALKEFEKEVNTPEYFEKMKEKLKLFIEKARQEGIKQGKKQEQARLFESLEDTQSNSGVWKPSKIAEEEWGKKRVNEGRLEVLKEIEKLFVHLEGDDITGGGIDGEYLSKEDFEALKKKVDK